VSFDSSRNKQGQPASSPLSSPHNGKRSAKVVKRALHATIEEYILDHRSQNHSPKTIEWQTLALGNFADFLEKKGVYNVKLITRARKRGAIWKLPKTVPACW
jgi:hypothetical protein